MSEILGSNEVGADVEGRGRLAAAFLRSQRSHSSYFMLFESSRLSPIPAKEITNDLRSRRELC